MSGFLQTFQRNLGSITEDEQRKLQESTVAVIGCGGLGGYVIEELARLGVGTLLIVDPDSFSESNLNRQLGALSATLGKSKAEAAAERVAAIHSYTSVLPYIADFRILPEDKFSVANVVIDCLDSIEARRELFSFCRTKKIPLVHGAVNGWFGVVAVQLPDNDLFSLLYPSPGGKRAEISSPSVLSFTVATVASLQVAEAVKLLLDISSSLHETILHLDLKSGEWLQM